MNKDVLEKRERVGGPLSRGGGIGLSGLSTKKIFAASLWQEVKKNFHLAVNVLLNIQSLSPPAVLICMMAIFAQNGNIGKPQKKSFPVAVRQ